MASISALIARRDALQEARETGAMEWEYEGRRMRYRTLADMDRILADMNAQIAASLPSATASPSVRNVRLQMSKGLT